MLWLAPNRLRAIDRFAYLLRFTTLNDDVTLVELQLDDTIDGPLAGRNGASDELPLRSEEVTVIEDSAESDSGELVTQSTDVPVKSQSLQIDMGSSEDGGSRRLVAPTGLDTDESVLDDVDTADTVFPAEGVEGEEDLDGVGDFLGVGGDDEFDGEAGLELDSDAFGVLRSILWSGGQLPHIGRRGDVGILEDAGLVGDVEQVLVGGPGLGCGLEDGDALLRCVLEQSLTTRELVVELWMKMSVNIHSIGF